MKKQLLLTIFVAVAVLSTLSGCVERRYYHRNHYHSPEYLRVHVNVVE